MAATTIPGDESSTYGADGHLPSGEQPADAASWIDDHQPDPPSGLRLAVLQALRKARAPKSIAELAEPFGVHLNTIRFHLEALTQTGQVEQVESAPSGPGRPPLMFRVRPGMDPAGPRSYRLLAAILATGLADGPETAAQLSRAGRLWGAALAGSDTATGVGRATSIGEHETIERLVAVLAKLGFAPETEPTAGPDRIVLRHCPFLELATTSTRSTCPVHLGLMQGVVEALGSAVDVERLDPFVEPDRCVASLARSRTGR